MPVEKEFKFVMSLDIKEEQLSNPILFKQYYLKNGGRVRFEEENGVVKKITFNYKEFISPELGQVEIETPLSQEDAHLLKSVASSLLTKVRCEYVDANNNKWEIDFFKDQNNETYFVLMELEVESKSDFDLSILPEYISSNILLEVSEDDNSFTSKKLENIEYAKLQLKKYCK